MAGRYIPFRFTRPTQTAPIDILPEEILTRIFFIICDEIQSNCTSRFPRLRKKCGVATISGVCARWRTIARRTMAFMILELPIEATLESIVACRQMISTTHAADMDIHIDFTRQGNNGRMDADYLNQVMDTIVPHSRRWRSLKIVIRASSFICPVLWKFQQVNAAPRLRVFKFLAASGSSSIPGFPLPGLVNNPNPLPLTHLSISGGKLVHLMNYQLPYLVDLEILDRAEDRELTLPWHEVAFLLNACPSLKELKLDCNIDYICLQVRWASRRPGGSMSPSSIPRCSCNGQVGPVCLRSLVDLRVNRYDIEEISALVLNLNLPAIESLTLSSVEVYATLQQRSAPGKPHKHDRSRLPTVCRNPVFERVSHLSLIDLEFDCAKTEKRSTFIASFFDAFPNLVSLRLLQCPEREFLAALVPEKYNYSAMECARCPQLQTLRIEGGSTGPIVDFVLARQQSFPIDALFLINTIVDQSPRDLIILDANVESFEHGDTYVRQGDGYLMHSDMADEDDAPHGMVPFHGY